MEMNEAFSDDWLRIVAVRHGKMTRERLIKQLRSWDCTFEQFHQLPLYLANRELIPWLDEITAADLAPSRQPSATRKR